MSRKIDRTVHTNSDFLRQVFNKTWILNCSGTLKHPYLRFSWCSGQSAQQCHCFHLHCHSTLKEKGEGRMGYNRSPLSRHWDLTQQSPERPAVALRDEAFLRQPQTVWHTAQSDFPGMTGVQVPELPINLFSSPSTHSLSCMCISPYYYSSLSPLP